MEKYYVAIQKDIVQYMKLHNITDASEYIDEIIDYIFENNNYFVTDYKCYEIIENNARAMTCMIEYLTEKYMETRDVYVFDNVLNLFNLFLYYRTKESACNDAYIKHCQSFIGQFADKEESP